MFDTGTAFKTLTGAAAAAGDVAAFKAGVRWVILTGTAGAAGGAALFVPGTVQIAPVRTLTQARRNRLWPAELMGGPDDV